MLELVAEVEESVVAFVPSIACRCGVLLGDMEELVDGVMEVREDGGGVADILCGREPSGSVTDPWNLL